jgi:DNA-binding response OmpR family regulator
VEYTGEPAVRAVDAVAPDAVSLDIGLPDINGFKVCRRIHSMSIRQPVIIALTGWGRDENRKDAAEAGFDAHITKPAGPELIISVLNEHLSARHRSDQLKP